MAAALRRHLILEENGGHTGTFKLLHGAHHIRGVAVAVVTVREDRDFDCIGNSARALCHFGHGQQRNIRSSQQSGTGRIAAEENRLEPGFFGQLGAQRVRHARNHRDFAALYKSSKFGSRFHALPIVLTEVRRNLDQRPSAFRVKIAQYAFSSADPLLY